MMRASRMTARAAASISFGMGSFILMADLTASVLRHGDEGGTVFDMGFPSLLGWAGLVLWVIGILFLVLHRRRNGRSETGGVRPVFIRNGDTFTCPSCGRKHDISKVDFHERYTCGCGRVYDIYPEAEGEKDIPP
ncbi:hypothetical protein B6U90_01800 [Thermoplasmatales archaeon ex4484_6]|nr:MAG: hypothetical protein B6U90_01800 [Thermoplasmatales archaeon ex4484_6]RLF69557.1 MAG: hypothetical protein DRN57_00470 [Thermoplasmata archaeon]